MSIDEPQNARSRRTRDAILSSAVELLRTDGPAAVTMSAVANRAGCSRRGVYLHFDTRAELLVSLIDYINDTEGFAEHRAYLEEASDPVDRLRRFGHFLGRYHTSIAPVVIAVERVRDSDQEAAEMWESAMRGWNAACVSTLRPLQEAGRLHRRFESLDEAVDLLWALMSIDILRRLVHERGWSGEHYGETMAEMFVATFVAR